MLQIKDGVVYWETITLEPHLTEVKSGGSRRGDCSTRMDNPMLVPQATSCVDSSTSICISEKDTSTNASFSDRNSCVMEKTKSPDLSYIRQDLKSKGISEDAASVILDSWRTCTKQQYNVYIQKWTLFCDKRKINPMYPSVALVLDYLYSLYKGGLGYSAINTARSALAAVFTLPGNVMIGTHPLICRFIKGVFQRKPAIPRYAVTWDVNIVLKYLKSLFPVEMLTLKQVTYKLVTLVALVTGQRCQTLALLNLDNMHKTPSGIVFHIPDKIKQTRPGYVNPTVVLPKFSGNRKLCVVKTMEHYLHLTESLRSDQTRELFITHCKPHGAASKATISRWVKETLQKSGIDTTIFKAHSTRAASTSAAMRGNVPLETILKTAGWNKDCVFRKFYQKPILCDNSSSEFGLTVLSEK
ncbi:uncharacterized protein [Argopecten irradians]|uniref:uncharacterized protein isoform X3 n=1 Tax=Argopecten irradians TaxID=31199 RepID=UPI0037198542